MYWKYDLNYTKNNFIIMLDSSAFPQIFFEFFRIFPFFVSEIVFTVFLILFPVFFTILQYL